MGQDLRQHETQSKGKSKLTILISSIYSFVKAMSHKYHECLDRLEINWECEMEFIYREDKKMDKLMQDFCRAVYLEKYKSKEEKKEALKSKLKVMQEDQNKKVEKYIGLKEVLKENKEVYDEMVECPKDHTKIDERIVPLTDACVAAGETFDVSKVCKSVVTPSIGLYHENNGENHRNIGTLARWL